MRVLVRATVPKEVEAAIKFALREVSLARPDNPVRFVAEKLREFASNMPAQVASYGYVPQGRMWAKLAQAPATRRVEQG